MSEYIATAAVQINGGNTVFTGPHHAACLSKLKSSTQQGFLTSTGRFVGRKKALEIAIDAGQKIEKHNPKDKLMSEDLKNDPRFEKIKR